MSARQREKTKREIIRMFRERVRGRRYTDCVSSAHCGAEGHWLERQFGIRPNSRVDADYKGFELKADSPKVSVGDWTADEYLYNRSAPHLQRINGNKHIYMDKNEFIRTFGYKNDSRDGRFGWAGRASPRYNVWNACGQCLVVCPESHNLYVVYSYRRDCRVTRDAVPDQFKTGYVAIVMWSAHALRAKIDLKWNQNGFFQVRKDGTRRNAAYHELIFSRPFDYEYFVEGIRQRQVVFESGMVENNNRFRNCSKFRVVNAWRGPFLSSLEEQRVT